MIQTISKKSNKKNDTGEVSELKQNLLTSKKSFIVVGFFSMFINMLMLVPPLYMLQLYDRVLTSKSEGTLYMLTGIVVVLFITMVLLEIVRSKVLIKISNKLDALLSQRIFSSLFDMANKEPGKATSMPLSDLTTVKQFMTGNGVFAFFDTPWIPIYIAVLFMFHPIFGYFAIFAAIVLMIFAYINQYTTKDKMLEANNLSRASSVYVDANLRNAEVVNAMGMKKNIEGIWKDKYYSFLNAQNDASTKAGVWANVAKGTRMLFQSLMLGLGGYLAIIGEVSPGMMIAGSIIMGRALAPLDLIIGSYKGFSAAKTSYGRLEMLLEQFPKDKEYMPLPEPEGEVLLEQVVVIPPGGQNPSVKGVSMLINKGDVVGVIGASAAGKSSLARVILGIWPLASGSSRLDGADIYQWDRVLLGKHVGYLPQDIELFDGTVSQNIARFTEVDAEKVVAAAQRAGIHEMILRLDEGYDTKIGAGGSTLSGGQRQRIAFARAIYDEPVLVVLDEPNSNLDDQGELSLVKSIELLKELETTVVIVTHRPSILDATNKLAVMQDGQLVGYGPTKEILAQMAEARNKAQAQQQQVAKPSATPKISLSKPGS